MKVLWICNQMPSILARSVGKKAGNKEGWVTGMALQMAENRSITMGMAFPVKQAEMYHGITEGITYYSFQEDTDHPEEYDSGLEASLGLICEEFTPDIIHIFGTEYPHTLAMLRLKEWRNRVLVHLQGLMVPYSEVFYAEIPEDVIEGATFRDVLKKDSIWQQKEKYVKRALNETECLKLCRHASGRTAFDREYLMSVNSSCAYYMVNETLRPQFYGKIWEPSKCVKHRIFVSQGNYPIKGIHFMLEALGKLVEKYPDVTLHVSGDKITASKTLKDKLKLSSYGKYLKALIKKYHLEEHVVFTGSLNAEQMLLEYMEAEVYVIPSMIENSPNSLGEAMILGIPSVAARVGGIPSIATEDEVLMYDVTNTQELANQISSLFDNPEKAVLLGRRAREHALLTHDAKANYKMLCWVYEKILDVL